MFDTEFLTQLGFKNPAEVQRRLSDDLENELSFIAEKEDAKYQSNEE